MLAKILFDDRVSRQLDPRDPKETDVIASTMLPQLRSVPSEYLYECYVLALEHRSDGNTYPITGGEILMAWHAKEQQLAVERVEGQRLLPENAATACARCYKRKDSAGRIIECLEINPANGELMGPCDHRLLTKEEKAEAEQKRNDFLAQMRAEIRRKEEARLKAEAEKPKPVKPVGFELQCSGCQRVVNTLGGWTEGERCGVILKTESAKCPKCQVTAGVQSLGKMVCRDCSHVYDVITCEGRMALKSVEN